MSDIRHIRDWRMPTGNTAIHERLLASLGSAEFGATVRDSVLALTAGARRVYLFESAGRDRPSLQYFHGEPGLSDIFPVYRRSFLRLDPITDAYRAAPRVSDVAVQRVRPGHIASSDFRRRVFDDPGIVERLSIVQRGADVWRVISVARHASDGCFSDVEIDSLAGLAGWVLPMLSLNRHRQAATPLTVGELEDRFANRFEALPRREREVCARAALGMSVDATALDLDIARTTVVTYRKRAYGRLGVASARELFALVSH